MLAHAIRFLTIEAVEKAQSGHPGMPLGLADVATVLFQKHLKFYAPQPKWKHRDKFIISNGHGSMLLYSLLYLTGYPDITLDHIKSFRQAGSPCAGHPEYGLLQGIETTTGHLGQGLANAVGMALADQQYNMDRYIFVTVSDGDLMEGSSHESLALAGEYKLSKLIVLYDRNNTTIDGFSHIGQNIEERMKYYGFETYHVNGHDPDEIDQAIAYAKESEEKPQFIVCNTISGYGVTGKEGTHLMHSGPIGRAVIDEMKKRLDWPYVPFEIPEGILQKWRDIGLKHAVTFLENPELDEDFKSFYPSKKLTFNVPELSPREAFGQIIEQYDVIGGSCDLGHSTQADHAAKYIAFGVRELGIAGILNGMVLSKLTRVFGTTFFIFSDYMKPAIRLAALMHIPTVFIFTHDSIGLGEDGTTHQPCEQLAGLRTIPHLNVYRPCDAYETQDCLAKAFAETGKPSVIVLAKQSIPVLNVLANGVVFERGKSLEKDIIFMATGSEVYLALEVAKALTCSVRVISIPCLEQFNQDYLLEGKKRVIIEAACRAPWEKYLRPGDLFFGVEDFGISAPYEDVYKHFGLTKERILGMI